VVTWRGGGVDDTRPGGAHDDDKVP
jgi:hypothetical protein